MKTINIKISTSEHTHIGIISYHDVCTLRGQAASWPSGYCVLRSTTTRSRSTMCVMYLMFLRQSMARRKSNTEGYHTWPTTTSS
ncbi:MAG: hypothetical protein KatS3mg038_1306 [Candidatus Kapaibacterium sp.]|nr:MAG: hypothetical protein KatS3mg038_1306 [Candidatus Kapabacteria bacterium]